MGVVHSRALQGSRAPPQLAGERPRPLRLLQRQRPLLCPGRAAWPVLLARQSSSAGKAAAAVLASRLLLGAMGFGGERRSRSRQRLRREKASPRRCEGGRSVATAARAHTRRQRSRSGSRRRGRDASGERQSPEPRRDSRVHLTARRPDRERERSRSDSRARRDAVVGDRSADFGKGGGRGKGGGGRGRGGRGSLAPLPRPGVDDDGRFQTLDDDPRYFEGAELGKAQKAALGIAGLNGRNTASFYPESTLVRPAMRVFYGQPGSRYKASLKTDDVVVVPDFFCEESSFDAYDRLLKEVRSLEANPEADLGELPFCQRAVAKMCKYFAIEEDGRALRLSFYKSGSDTEPLVRDLGKFGRKLPRGANCLATLALGATRELACHRPVTEESLFFPQVNGALTLFGRDACLRWHQGMNMYPQEKSSGRGHISMTVLGTSALLAEDASLGPLPSDEKHGAEAFSGRLDRPCSDLARPSMRIITAPPRKRYGMPLKHDDVVVVPEFACPEDDWDLYYKLLREMRQSQAEGAQKAEWVSWHEGAHLLSQNPTGSETYHRVIDKICDYFSIAQGNRGTRFNWYRDGSDWKPFHHDSAAFNERRAKTQNTTIGISFGASRELAFRHAKSGELIYFPQRNGMLFYFGRDANIVWQHGINALPEKEQDAKGRISIILWGLCTAAVEEAGSPPMLTDDSRGGGKGKGKGKGGFSMQGQQACRDFAAGRCTYGDRCRFSHGA